MFFLFLNLSSLLFGIELKTYYYNQILFLNVSVMQKQIEMTIHQDLANIWTLYLILKVIQLEVN